MNKMPCATSLETVILDRCCYFRGGWQDILLSEWNGTRTDQALHVSR